MKYDEFQEMCHKAWSERFNYLCSDVTKSKNEGKYCIFNESKTTYIECIPKVNLFNKVSDVSNQKRRKFTKICTSQSHKKAK